MSKGDLGKVYQDGEIIVRQGEVGQSMFVIQEGQVEVLQEKEGKEVRLRTASAGEILGEMAIIDRVTRSATVRALGEVRVLTVDKRTFLQRISEDPSMAFKMLQDLSNRVRELSAELARLKDRS
ncbi:MAG: cyclic nucleotide-binding domain-containing protein [Phycisphaerales bacterium]|nr:MAG: cyclic nucleotide-binding domain-containing protein [Phycisphaerales bacterium]